MSARPRPALSLAGACLLASSSSALQEELYRQEFAQNLQHEIVLEPLGDVNGDGVPDVAVGEPDEPVDGKLGRVRVLSGETGELIHTISNPSFSRLGASLLAVDDRNADGVRELLVGAPGPPGFGWIALFSGADGALIWAVEGQGLGDRFGCALAPLSDIDADGFHDVAVGAHQSANGSGETGYVAAISLKWGFWLSTFDSPSGQLSGVHLGSAGDWDQDGELDVALVETVEAASPLVDSESQIVVARADGATLLVQTTGVLNKDPGPQNVIPRDLGTLGDLNQDGAPELGFGRENHFDFQVWSAPSGTLLWEADGIPLGGSPSVAGDFGTSSAAAGDLDGDGVGDVLVGASRGLLHGVFTGYARVLSGATGSTLAQIASPQDELGVAAAGPGDLDGDGLGDLLLVGEGESALGAQRYLSAYSGAVVRTRQVPFEYASIQAAVDAAQPEDTILVDAGHYEGAVDFGGKELRLIGDQGSGRTFLHPGDERGLSIQGVGGAGAIVEGLTVVGGRADRGGALLIENAHAELRDCVFRRSSASLRGGVVALEGASASFVDCELLEGAAPEGGSLFLQSSFASFEQSQLGASASEATSAAVHVDAGSGIGLVSSTLATAEGRALLVAGVGVLESSIVWNGAGPAWSGPGTLVGTYSNVEGGLPGVGNLDVDPQLYDMARGPLVPQPGSPVVDAGDPSLPLDPDGSLADVGKFWRTHAVDTPSESLTALGPLLEDGDVVFLGPGQHFSQFLSGADDLSLLGAGRDQSFVLGAEPSDGHALQFIENAECLVQGLTLVDEFANGIFIGLSAAEAHLRLRDVRVTGWGQLHSAAVKQGFGSLSVESCLFDDNSGTSGGALSSARGWLEVVDSHFRDNEVLSGGAAITADHSTVLVRGSTFQANGCTGGASALLYFGPFAGEPLAPVRFERCTFADNTSTTGSLLRASDHQVELSHSIVWDNAAPLFGTSGQLNVEYSDVEGGAAGPGNLDQDPLFLLAAAGDLRLAPGSPCIDAGDPLAPADPDGSVADLGYRPFQAPSVGLDSVQPAALPAVAQGADELSLRGPDAHLATALTYDGQAVDLGAASTELQYDPLLDEGLLRFDAPLATQLGTIQVVASGPGGSGALEVEVLPVAAAVLDVEPNPTSLAAGVSAEVGAAPGDLVVLAWSPHTQPSALPGIVSLGIGKNFSSLFVLSSSFTPAQGWVTGQLDTSSSTVGGVLHLQAAVLEAGGSFPLATTNIVSVVVEP